VQTIKSFDPYAQRKMALMYEIFPYPNRPIFLVPKPEGSLEAHISFGTLLSEGQFTKAREVWTVSKSAKNAQKRILLTEMNGNQNVSAKILLVGCGTDEPLLFHVLHPRCHILGLDISASSVRRAYFKLLFYRFLPAQIFKRILQVFRGVSSCVPKIVASEASQYLSNNPSEKFQYVQCFGVLHHQQNPKSFLFDICKSVERGGVLRLMIYSHQGRRLERRIQKRYSELWNQALFGLKDRLMIRYENFKLWFWQRFNQKFGNTSTLLRFKYLGYNKATVADALMHPCDTGLDPSSLQKWLEEFGMKIVFCEASVSDDGKIAGFENANEVWKKIIEADKKEGLLSNIVLIAKKEG
jgi:Methyltransferase domain